MKASTKRKIKILLSPFHRIGLKNKSFTIISNNCWAGYYYDRYHLPYLTPTIGLFIPPKDYLKFLSNLDDYLSIDNTIQVKPSDSKYYEMLKRKEEKGWISSVDDLIIGKINDIEVVFLHYTSFDEACCKWNNRKKRINKNNMLIKFNDQNEFVESDYDAFLRLNYHNKIFFSSNRKFKSSIVFLKKNMRKNMAFVLMI